MIRWISIAMLGMLGFLLSMSVAAAAPRGQAEYLRYCSACHGRDADGQGPVANVLNPRPPALLRLDEKKYGSPLASRLVAYVMGGTMPRAHGVSDMPVWGENLREPGGSDSKAVATIWLIVDYLESIQLESIQLEPTEPDVEPESP